MQTKTSRLASLLVVMIMGAFINISTLNDQEIAATPEPTTPQSLFVEDTCVPPCWFGLIPGESSEEEVLAFLDAYALAISVRPSRKLFDSETGELISTHYSFTWRNYSYFNPPRVNLTVQNGVLDRIWANPDREITFGEMLDILGYPDRLYLGTVGWSLLTAIYVEPRLRILLDSRSMSCQIQNVEYEFRVMDMRYFSIEVAEELVTPIFSEIEVNPQPQLLFQSENDYAVSIEQLEQWLSGQVDATCSEVWYQLHTENDKS